MATEKISTLPESNSMQSSDYLELSQSENFTFVSKKIQSENFRNSMTIPDHNISEHEDITATGVQLNTLVSNGNADSLHTHDTSHTIPEHTDTNADGAQLNTLTNGSNADSLHTHNLPSHSISEHTDTSVTGTQLNTLVGGGNADSLHIHSIDSHTIDSHDTNATGDQLDTLTNGSNADSLHSHNVISSHNINSHDTNATGTQLNELVGGSEVDHLHIHDYENLEDKPSPGSLASTGTIIMFISTTPPFGFLECNGQLISKTTYSGLYNHLKDGGSTCIYGETVDDFYIPDYRGRFLRGWDHGAGRDPDRTTRTDRGDGTIGDNIGTIQNDEFKNHNHDIAGSYQHISGTQNYASYLYTSGGTSYNLLANGGNETRPKNINFMYCIKI